VTVLLCGCASGELEASVVPYWQWNGEYSKLPDRPFGAKPEDINAKDFSPWQYAEMHVAEGQGK